MSQELEKRLVYAGVNEEALVEEDDEGREEADGLPLGALWLIRQAEADKGAKDVVAEYVLEARTRRRVVAAPPLGHEQVRESL
jgi:hypothetical protein